MSFEAGNAISENLPFKQNFITEKNLDGNEPKCMTTVLFLHEFLSGVIRGFGARGSAVV